jgi:hypothetical protein
MRCLLSSFLGKWRQEIYFETLVNRYQTPQRCIPELDISSVKVYRRDHDILESLLKGCSTGYFVEVCVFGLCSGCNHAGS